MRALLDTNIVLDYLLAREPFVRAATGIWQAGAKDEYEPFVSSITPVNLYFIARKLKGDAEARRVVQGLLAICQIAITDYAVLVDALRLPMKDYEDAVQTASARAVSLDVIVTRDVSDYAGAEIPILTPEQFLALITASKPHNDD